MIGEEGKERGKEEQREKESTFSKLEEKRASVDGVSQLRQQAGFVVARFVERDSGRPVVVPRVSSLHGS